MVELEMLDDRGDSSAVMTGLLDYGLLQMVVAQCAAGISICLADVCVEVDSVGAASSKDRRMALEFLP